MRCTTAGQESNEPTTQSRTAAPGTFAPEVASTHEQKFLALGLRIVVAITNFERGDDPGREKLNL